MLKKAKFYFFVFLYCFFIKTVYASYNISGDTLNVNGGDYDISYINIWEDVSNIYNIDLRNNGSLALDKNFKSGSGTFETLTNVIINNSALNLGDNSDNSLTGLTVSNTINITNGNSRLNFIKNGFNLSTNKLSFNNASGSTASMITGGNFSNITNLAISGNSQFNLNSQISTSTISTTTIEDNAKLIFSTSSNTFDTIKINNNNASIGFSNNLLSISINDLEFNNIGIGNTASMITGGNFSNIQNFTISSNSSGSSTLTIDSKIADLIDTMNIVGGTSKIIFETDTNQINVLKVDATNSSITIDNSVSDRISLDKFVYNNSNQTFNDAMILDGKFHTINEVDVGANILSIYDKDIATNIDKITIGSSSESGMFNMLHTIAETVGTIDAKDGSFVYINIDPATNSNRMEVDTINIGKNGQVYIENFNINTMSIDNINLDERSLATLGMNSLNLQSINISNNINNNTSIIENAFDSATVVENLILNSSNINFYKNISGKFQSIDTIIVNNSSLIYNNINNVDNLSDSVADTVNHLILADNNSLLQIGDIEGHSTNINLQSLDSNWADITFVDPNSSINTAISGNVDDLKFIDGEYSSMTNAITTDVFEKINNFYITNSTLELDRTFSNSVNLLSVSDESTLILDNNASSFLDNTRSVFGKDSLLTIKLFNDASGYGSITSNTITLDDDATIKFDIENNDRHLGLTFGLGTYDMDGFGVGKTLNILNYDDMNKNFILTTEGRYDNLYELIYLGDGKYHITKRLADSTTTELKILEAVQRVRFETIPVGKVRNYIDYLVSLMSTANTRDPTEITRALRAMIPNDDFKQRMIRNNIFNVILQSVSNRLLYGNLRAINRHRKNTRLNPYYHYEDMYDEQLKENLENMGLSAGDVDDIARYETISLWGKGIYGLSKMGHEENDFKGFKAITKGIIGGLELNLSRFLTLGGGYLLSSTEAVEKQSKDTTINSQGMFGYGRIRIGNFYINGVGSALLFNTKDESKFSDPVSGTYNTDYKTTAIYLQAVMGYNFMFSKIVLPWETEKILDHKKILYGITPPYVVISPEIGIRISSSIQESYEDSVGFQTVPRNNENVLTGVAGFKIHKISATTDDVLYQYYFHLDLAKDIQSNIKDTKTIDLFGGLTYSLPQRKAPDYTIEFGAGVSFDLFKHLEFSLSYEGRYTKRYIENSATAGFRLKY